MVYVCTRCSEAIDFNIPSLNDKDIPKGAMSNFREHSESCERRAEMKLIKNVDGELTTEHQRKSEADTDPNMIAPVS